MLYKKFQENKASFKIKTAFKNFMKLPEEKKVVVPFEKYSARKNHFQYFHKDPNTNFPCPTKYRPKKLEK